MTLKLPIYFDNQASTPVDPRVLTAMLPYFTEHFGNPSSRSHAFGWVAEEAVERAREQVAALIGAKTPKEIVWTSGATEATNLAIKGAVEANKHGDRNHLITQKTEHKATLDTCKHLEKLGCSVTYLDVDAEGRVNPDDVRAAITDQTLLVSVMLANNEVGTVQPIAEIGRLCHERGVLFHCDAAQGVGKLPFDVEAMCVDLASISAHKIYGPKGVGALFVRNERPRVQLVAQIDGGGHERKMRSGTLNVPGIVGFGKACELCGLEMAEETRRIEALRDRLERGLFDNIDLLHVNGSRSHRLPGNLNVSFPYVEGESLMMALKDVAISSGSACTSASLEPSYVLRAMGVSDDLAHTSIRFGLGRFNTEEEVDHVVRLAIEKVRKLRDLSPLYEMAKEGIDLSKIEWNSPHHH
ncbi:MAG: IscS subfamily cysteine desulfurase [Myxococcales bacterium]|jgi:cysteine desulfurase|nr:IscS subfamily cysteine desulfurase [Myxococcales bacterium]